MKTKLVEINTVEAGDILILSNKIFGFRFVQKLQVKASYFDEVTGLWRLETKGGGISAEPKFEVAIA